MVETYGPGTSNLIDMVQPGAMQDSRQKTIDFK